MSSLLLANMSIGDKLAAMYPEVVLFAAACAAMIIGPSANPRVRALCAPITLLALIIAGALAFQTTPLTDTAVPGLALYGKVLAAAIGFLLVLVLHGVADRDYEDALRTDPARNRFDSGRSNRGEFYAFFLFSITGLMLVAGADDLIWLFLALELTSLPTYILVAISTARNRSMEAGVKYFFLGALGAATFLFGFALLYGATGSTFLADIRLVLAQQTAAGGLNPIAIAGLILSVIGIGFKIAAVPMHFYTPDVYEGASASVSAMLAFVPKAAGFFALILILAAVGWNDGRLPSPIHEVLVAMAVLTMTVGNVLALLQSSVKRILAYSSIAHSGYMLVGLIAGPAAISSSPSVFSSNGLAAVLLYLAIYGVMNLGAFAVLASLERTGPDGRPEEIDRIDDLRGLCRTRPVLGYTLVLSALAMLGFPPTAGFLAKLPLFTSAFSAGHAALLIVLAINSAIAAAYYLRLAYVAWLDSPEPTPGSPLPATESPVRVAPFAGRLLAGIASSVGIIILALPLGLLAAAESAGRAPTAGRGSTIGTKSSSTGEPAANAATTAANTPLLQTLPIAPSATPATPHSSPN